MANSVPNFQTGRTNNREEEQDYDASVSAAMVAVNLISSARVILKLDNVYTEYSAQYLVDNACPEKEDEKLTVKDALKFALKQGIPKERDWRHLGCRFKRPSSSCIAPPPLVSLKGEVVEPKNLEEALEFFLHQPIGARLHVFTPDLDRLGDGIYVGPSCTGTSYVGLRDVIISEIKEIEGEAVAIVKICYKKKESFIKVDLAIMFLQVPANGNDDSQVLGPTGLLVDFCLPRLSI